MGTADNGVLVVFWFLFCTTISLVPYIYLCWNCVLYTTRMGHDSRRWNCWTDVGIVGLRLRNTKQKKEKKKKGGE